MLILSFSSTNLINEEFALYLSERFINVTLLAILAKYNDSWKALFPPPTTATYKFL